MCAGLLRWSLLICLALGAVPARADVVGWMGPASISSFAYADYSNWSTVPVSLKFIDGNYEWWDPSVPYSSYAPFGAMTFSVASVGQTWRVERGAGNPDFDGVVGLVSNGREDWMRWEIVGMVAHTNDWYAFHYGSIPLRYDPTAGWLFVADLAGQRIDWMALTLNGYSQWWSPNTSAYCESITKAGLGGCHDYHNVQFSYSIAFGNDDPAPVPGPAAASLVVIGLASLAAWRRRTRRHA